MIAADIVAQSLQAHGVTFLSTLVGNGIDPVLHAARAAGLRVIDTHNEQTASYMAESYGRLTGRIGVCAVSSSVGFTNALIGAVNAHFDGAPMLLIAGASDRAYAGRGCFQDFDQVAAASPIFKNARLVDHPDKIAFHIHEAIAAATSGRPGPVHLTIPLDVLNSQVSQAPALSPLLTGSGLVQPACRGSAALVEQAAASIAASERPLLVAGSGVFYAHGEDALARFLTQTDMPVMAPIWDRGSVASPLPQFMGVIGAASGSPRLLDSADLVILAGARVDYRVGYMQPPEVRSDVRIVRISADAGELHQGVEPSIAIHGDARSVLEQIALLLPDRPSATQARWLEEAQQRNRQFHARWATPLSSSGPMTGRHIVEALRSFVQGDTVFVVDGGNIGQWVHMAMCDRYPGHWLTCGASGVVGFGMGGGMAAKVAYPQRPAILLSGDGSMGFNIADWESATRQNLPFVGIVADDQAWGIVVSGQTRRYGAADTVAARLGRIRFDQMAEACGALGMRVEEPRDLAPAIERGLAAARPCLIHVPIAHGGPAD